MTAFKNRENNTWYVQFRCPDWKSEQKQEFRRSFAIKKEAQSWKCELLEAFRNFYELVKQKKELENQHLELREEMIT